MRRRVLAVLTAAVLGSPLSLRASVPVEQVEAYDPYDSPPAPTGYAPLNFNNLPSITLGPGDLGGGWDGITLFDAVPGSDTVNTESGHANLVAHYFYTQGTPAYPFVTDVYCAQADNFLNDVVLAQNDVSNSGPVPLGFSGGSKVISNTYIGSGTDGQNLDQQRRYDFMAASGDAVVVSAAVTVPTTDGITYQVWSSFNCLAVSGVQSFDPTGSPGKQHADLYIGLDASFSTAVVASYATALIGTAESDGSTDGRHAAVVRSLLMSTADKGVYTRGTANNLDLFHGAGTPDYPAALSVLQNGEQSLLTVTNGVITGTGTSNPKGWSYGSVQPGGTTVLLIDAPVAITGVTASLNWDVTSNQPTPDTIDTTDAGLIFPNLSLSLQPLNPSSQPAQQVTWAMGAAQTDPDLISSLHGDNVQYLYSTSTISGGMYALTISGDANLPANFAISYVLRGSFASDWNTSNGSWGSVSNWTAGIPDNQAAVANFTTVTDPITVTLDGDHTVGRINFTSPVGFTIGSGTGGMLTIDDTGDSTGTANPLINVSTGSHEISAPISLAAGVTVSVATGSALTISGVITGTGGLTKSGPGALTLTAAESYGDTAVSGGTLTLGAAASLSGALNVSGGATAILSAANGSSPLIRTFTGLGVTDGKISVAAAPNQSGRTLLVTPTIAIAGAGSLDLGSNDLDVTGDLAAVTAMVASGYNLTGGATWDGPGINSSAAAADSMHLAALAVVQNNQSGTPLFNATNTFDGYTPGAADILVKYTLFGDANLDGVVDGSDYSLIDAGFASDGSLTGWYNGDFNYDGVVDGSDYALIDNAFNNQTQTFSPDALGAPGTAEVASPASAVPEPACLVLAGTIGIAMRRRRHPDRFRL